MNQTASQTSNGPRKYTMRVARPSPSMSEDAFTIEAPTYAEAVEQARTAYRSLGRTVALSSHRGVYVWHHIASDGSFWDRNTNSGVPATGCVQ